MACSPSSDELHRVQNQSLQSDLVLLSPSSQIIVNNKGGVVCFAPAPDAAQEIGMDVSVVLPFTVTTGGQDQADGFDDQIPLGGRNPNVLITRALLFESCMVESRSNMTKEERLKHWARTLEAIEKINNRTLEGGSVSSDNFSGSLPTPTSQSQSPSTNAADDGIGSSLQ